jgi:hypothetical protein
VKGLDSPLGKVIRDDFLLSIKNSKSCDSEELLNKRNSFVIENFISVSGKGQFFQNLLVSKDLLSFS